MLKRCSCSIAAPRKHAANPGFRGRYSELAAQGSKYISPVSQTLTNLGFDFTLRPDGTGFLTDDLRLKNGPTQNQFNVLFASEEIAQDIISLGKGDTLKAIKISGVKVQ